MKQFLAFVKKEFFHIFRDKRTMLILFGMPIAQILIFGYVVNNEIKDVRIAILDPSRDEVTRQITEKIVSSGYFKLDHYISSANEIEKTFRKGVVKEVILFEPEFAAQLEREKTAHIQIIADASDPNTANLVSNYTASIVNGYMVEMNREMKTKLIITPEVRMMFNPDMKSSFMFVPGTMALILMLLSAMMTSISIAREKEIGTMEVLLVSPLKPFQIIIGKVMPYIGFAFINACVIVLFGTLVFGVPINGSLVLLMSECLLFITLALSLGILISTAAATQQIAMFISMFALMLPTMLLSGFIFPIENMPMVMQWLCNIMPPRWFIIIIKNIMIKGTDFSFVWKETLILIGFVILFITLSIKKFKIRLE